MYKTIIFDFDGTLCSSITTIASALQHTFIHFGYPAPSMASISRMCALGPNLHDTFTLLEPKLDALDKKTFDKWCDFYRSEYSKMAKHQCHLYPHVEQMLSQLKGLGLELLIVSQKNKSSIGQSLKRFKIDQFFSEIFGEMLAHPGKPSPHLFEYDILPSRPSHRQSDFLMVGDTVVDIQFAKNCGIDVAWAEYGYGDIPKDLHNSITFHLHTPMDLITELNKKTP